MKKTDEETIFLPNDRVVYYRLIGEQPVLGTIKRIWGSGRFQVLLDNGSKVNVPKAFLIHLNIKRV